MASPPDVVDHAAKLLENFRRQVEDLKRIYIKLEKLNGLISEREVSRATGESLRGEYLSELSTFMEHYFEINKSLEEARARLMVELERLKLDVSIRSETGGVGNETERLRRLEYLVNEADVLSEALELDVSLSLIKDYLTHITATFNTGNVTDEVFKQRKSFCRKFLEPILEKWVLEKSKLVARISELDAQASGIKEKMREIWARYMVGEYDRGSHSSLNAQLEGDLSKLEGQAREYRSRVDSIDSKMAEVLEVLEEG